MTTLPSWAVWVLSPAEGDFIYAALDAALDVPVYAIEQAGGDVEVVVTDAQVEAARMIVDHDEATGRKTSEAIRKIAAAVPQVANGAGGQGK